MAIIIPVYNEGDRFDRFLKQLICEAESLLDQQFVQNKKISNVHIVIVDDGSVYPLSFSSYSESPPARCDLHSLRHEANLGQGAALQTGISYARDKLDADIFVTLDADGQHDPKEIRRFIHTMLQGSFDIVFGNRFANDCSNMPTSRRLILTFARWFERALTGLRLHDVHNGYRVFNKNCARFISLKQHRMAHATEFKQLVARHKLVYGEVETTIKYSAETLAKGQSNSGSIIILKDIFKAFLFGR